MKLSNILLLGLLVTACAEKEQRVVVETPKAVITVDTVNTACGVEVIIYQDATLLTTFEVCNGVNGENGTNHDPQDIVNLTNQIVNLQADISNLNSSITNILNEINDLENQLGQQAQFIKICTPSNEYGIRVGTNLYAVYYDKVAQISYLALLNVGVQYQTTDNLFCNFTVDDQGNTTTISSLPPSNNVTGKCKVENTNQTSGAYRITVDNNILNNAGQLSITLTQGTMISGHNYNGGGAVTTVGNPFIFKPSAGIATDFLVYKNGNGTVLSASIVKESITYICGVLN